MQCFISTIQDIYFSLALEEYLLMQDPGEFFILWKSVPAVVVGKHQNTLAEINYRYVLENGIAIARRLSGGGTVYHDGGNLNFTWIANGEPGKLVDFRKFMEPVIDFLGALGLSAEMGPKNEIFAGGKKISGNAEHVFKSRVLHHGTLLFQSDLSLLRESLRVVPGRYRDRAVQSNRSSVINISECLKSGMEMASFESAFLDYMLTRTNGKKLELSQTQTRAISDLADSKYRSWDWIFGWSPDYELNSNFQFQEWEGQIFIKAHRGIIKECVLHSKIVPGEDLESLAQLLHTGRHDVSSIKKALRDWKCQLIRDEDAIGEIAWSFF
jgi:lipoate-protein ligase A